MYKTANDVSSSPANKIHSEKLVDDLLINNAYDKSTLEKIKHASKSKRKKKKSSISDNGGTKSTLKIPYLSDQCTARIKNAAKKHKIPIRVVSTPGLKLKNILTSSRPLDKPKCPNNNCITCKALKGSGKCNDQNIIYHMNCEMETCLPIRRGNYDGETLRETHDRFDEHYRQAKNTTGKSYVDKPWAKHYQKYHPNCESPKICIEVVGRASTTIERKIREARAILKNNSDLNDKNEQSDIRRFLVGTF